MKKPSFIIILFLFASLIPAYVYAESISFELGGETSVISYDSQNVVINNVQPDLDFASLILDVQVTDFPATLEIDLQRDIIDSKDNEGQDIPFIVLEDGFDIPFEVVETTQTHRVLSMELSQGTQEVEIIGTELGMPAPEEEPTTPPPIEEPVEEPEEEPTTPPPIEEPVEEPEEKQEPKQEEKPKTEKKSEVECGSGTVLRNGTCVLPEQCGPGTVLKDGQCVLAPQQTEPAPKQLNRDLVVGVMASFVIALAVAFILWLISRGSRAKTS